jgi:hypothetical protein
MILEKVFNAILSANIPSTIIKSFQRAGLEPTIGGGNVIYITSNVLSIRTHDNQHGEEDSNDEDPPVSQDNAISKKGKRIKTPLWGLLNEQQLKLRTEGKCPLCGK